MSGLLDYVAEAIRLLRDQADAVHELHNAPGETTFEGEPEAEAAYAELERVANGLETEIAARLRGDGEQGQAVAWIKPDWSDPKNFDGKSPVTTYPQLGWTPLYIHPQPAPSEQVAASVAVPEGLIHRVEEAARRIESGHAPRRIPADPTDVDLVLGEVLAWLKGEPAPFWVPAAAPVAPEREG